MHDAMIPQRRLARSRRRMAGLSLIELMISITLGLIILTAVALVFSNASNTRTELERTSRQIENGRYAIELLSDDLRLAGFYGELSVGSLSDATVPATPVPVALPDPCSNAAADWNSAMHVHVQGYSGGAGAPTTCLPTSLNFQPNTDILVVRRARGCSAGVAGCDAVQNGKPYVQVSLCATVLTTHSLGLEGTAVFGLKKKDCLTEAVKREYYVHIYYVSADNGSGVAMPTLKRLELTPGTAASATSPANFTVVPLVEGIEHFKVEYGLDTDVTPDGSPDVYVGNPNDYPAGTCAAACQVANWRNAVTVKLYVLARNLDASATSAVSRTYNLGGASYTPTDTKVRRHVYTALVRMPNPSGRRDTP
jgi:type IV pilus assembly protein PilW